MKENTHPLTCPRGPRSYMHHPSCPREYPLTVCHLGSHRLFHSGHSSTPSCPLLNTGGATAVVTLWFSSLDCLKLLFKVSFAVSFFGPSLREEVMSSSPFLVGPQRLSVLDVACPGDLLFSLPTRVGKVMAAPRRVDVQDFLR